MGKKKQIAKKEPNKGKANETAASALTKRNEEISMRMENTLITEGAKFMYGFENLDGLEDVSIAPPKKRLEETILEAHNAIRQNIINRNAKEAQLQASGDLDILSFDETDFPYQLIHKATFDELDNVLNKLTLLEHTVPEPTNSYSEALSIITTRLQLVPCSRILFITWIFLTMHANGGVLVNGETIEPHMLLTHEHSDMLISMYFFSHLWIRRFQKFVKPAHLDPTLADPFNILQMANRIFHHTIQAAYPIPETIKCNAAADAVLATFAKPNFIPKLNHYKRCLYELYDAIVKYLENGKPKPVPVDDTMNKLLSNIGEIVEKKLEHHGTRILEAFEQKPANVTYIIKSRNKRTKSGKRKSRRNPVQEKYIEDFFNEYPETITDSDKLKEVKFTDKVNTFWNKHGMANTPIEYRSAPNSSFANKKSFENSLRREINIRLVEKRRKSASKQHI